MQPLWSCLCPPAQEHPSDMTGNVLEREASQTTRESVCETAVDHTPFTVCHSKNSSPTCQGCFHCHYPCASQCWPGDTRGEEICSPPAAQGRDRELCYRDSSCKVIIVWGIQTHAHAIQLNWCEVSVGSETEWLAEFTAGEKPVSSVNSFKCAS